MQIQVTCASSKCKPIRFKFCMRGFPITAQYPTKGRSKIFIFNFSHERYWHPNVGMCLLRASERSERSEFFRF